MLLHVLRIHVSSWPSSTPVSEYQIPASALALSEACIRCARQSIQLLTDCWIDGSFATFDYFYTEYLFSALTILAVSGLLDGKDSGSYKDSFHEAARFLSQLKDAGNYVAHEYYRHIEAIRAALETVYTKRKAAMETLRVTDEADFVSNLPQPSQILSARVTTGGMALNEPSLQELLAQPVLDLQFLDGFVYDAYSQGLYWPDFSTERWTPDS